METLSVQDTLKLILENSDETPLEYIPLTQANRRILADNLISKYTNPPFDTSAMDGYALKNNDIQKLPIQLKLIGEARAGLSYNGQLANGECVRIFTGAKIPIGADHVVIQENTSKHGKFIEIHDHKISSNNIRKRGGDFSKGDILLKKGTKLGSRSIMLAAAMGYPILPVHKKPIIGIFATGDELVEPNVIPNSEQIIASNSYGLFNLFHAQGAEVFLLGIAKDTHGDIVKKFTEANKADILVTTGGVSVGDYDKVAPAFSSIGMKIRSWNISMKPGKPMLYGNIGKKIIFGLPGNPISALICARVFLIPLLHKMLGYVSDKPSKIKARLLTALEENGPRQHYMRGECGKHSNGEIFVIPQDTQDSSLVSLFAKANCLIIREANAPKIEKNTEIEIVPFDF